MYRIFVTGWPCVVSQTHEAGDGYGPGLWMGRGPGTNDFFIEFPS